MCGPRTKNEEGLVHIQSVLLRNHQRKSENQETRRFFLSPFSLSAYFLFFFGNFCYSQIISLCYITMSVIFSHIPLEICIVYLFIFFSFHFTFQCSNKKNSTWFLSFVIPLSYQLPHCSRLIDIKPSSVLLRIFNSFFQTFLWVLGK